VSIVPWRNLIRSDGRSPAFTALSAIVGVVALLALLAPLSAAEQPLLRVGVLLAIAGILELLHAVRRADASDLRRGLASGTVTLLMSLLIINAPFLAGAAIVVLLAGSFGLDALGYAAAAWRATTTRTRTLAGLAAAGNLAVVAFLLGIEHRSSEWVVTIAAAVRMLGTAWTMAVTPVNTADDASQTLLDDLELGEHPEADALRDEVAAEEAARAPNDRRLILSFVLILFSIHIARMQPDGSLVGFVAPAVAVIGDMVLAALIVLAVVIPTTVTFRRATRWIEQHVWRWYLASPGRQGWRQRTARGWLKFRLRIGMRLRESRYSLPMALRRSLISGLPAAAVIAATVPVWGMSWFFDTENWASGIWNSWAESRTDEWRAAMVAAVAGDGATPTTFALTPPGTDGDFSFIVIGDTGEGDASQNVLRDQLLKVAAADAVRFVVISSDVVYPNGAMIDYEAKFWLPFKGVDKPVYAIPGNHDWYDALEAFVATFLEPDAARAAMKARANADLRLTSTTESRIDHLIGEAARLRAEYRVRTGFQRAPFFEIQTDHFALLAIDTGIVKRVDAREWDWLEAALARADGKLTMAILGHPFYAGGFDLAVDHEGFSRLKRLLLDRGVAITMAGDTHDLEYYAEPSAPGLDGRFRRDGFVHHFVNGGGGAYLSFGTALQWPAAPPTARWAYYPHKQAVTDKIVARTPAWKRPAWWWTTRFNAWPFSAEWLSGVFDYNVAPFFQSFIEVRVEPSARRVRLLPHGIYGQLQWKDLARPPDVAGPADDHEPVQWVVPMR
jgi:uncharacterized membrane protein HdeD (DUF308 family)